MDAPINFLGDGANTLSWESPAGVDHYQIDMQSGEDWNNIANPDSSATSVTLEGSFIYGQLYRIRAFDAGGDYADAFWQFFAGPDTAPDSVNLTDVGDGSNVNVAWTWPGGSPSSGRDIPVEGVRVVWSWNNESAFSSGAYQDLSTGDYSTTITGGPGNLKVAVASFNSYSGGASTTAEIDISTPLLPPDGSFGDNVLNDNADGTANLLWTYGPGAQPVDGFRVYWTWNGSSPRESGAYTDNGSSANGMTITGGPGNLWAYVVAFNGAGEGAASGDLNTNVTDTTGPGGIPYLVRLDSLVSDGDGRYVVTIAWTGPEDMTDVVGYVLTGSVGETPLTAYSDGLTNSTSFLANPGEVVSVNVATIDSLNNSGTPSDGLTFTALIPPATPTDLTLLAVYQDTSAPTAGVQWVAPDGGDAPEYYRVEYQTGGGAWVNGGDYFGTAAQVHLPTTTADYLLRVVAVNGGGESPPSATVAVSIVWPLPHVPVLADNSHPWRPTGNERTQGGMTLGAKFTLSAPITVTALGRYFIPNVDDGEGTDRPVAIFAEGNTTPLAVAIVSTGHETDGDGYKWTDLPEPLALEPGQYRIGVTEPDGVPWVDEWPIGTKGPFTYNSAAWQDGAAVDQVVYPANHGSAGSTYSSPAMRWQVVESEPGEGGVSHFVYLNGGRGGFSAFDAETVTTASGHFLRN